MEMLRPGRVSSQVGHLDLLRRLRSSLMVSEDLLPENAAYPVRLCGDDSGNFSGHDDR